MKNITINQQETETTIKVDKKLSKKEIDILIKNLKEVIENLEDK